MSMTESEATKVIKGHIQFLRENWKPHPDYNVIEALGEAITALEKIQQYRAIGTVEGYERAIQISIENYNLYREYKAKVQEFEAIGTVSEFRELKEKATVQKSILYPFPKCPICKCSLAHALVNYCHACGQKLGLSEGKE